MLDLPGTAPDQVMPSGGAATRRVVDVVAADDVLVEALRAGRRLWRPSCLIHGDVKWDNTILDPGPPVTVKLFDWELAGSGDPAWDVGSALADLLSVRIRHGTAPDRPAGHATWLGEAELALLRGYAAAAGWLDEDFAERACLCWVGRCVHLGLETAAGTGSGELPAVTGLISAATRLAAVRAELSLTIRAAVDGGR